MKKLVTILFILLTLFLLFLTYTKFSFTIEVNSDDARLFLQSVDILHGNFFLNGWNLSTDNFWTTLPPFYLLLFLLIGFDPTNLHFAPALIYTLTFVISFYIAGVGLSKKESFVARMIVIIIIGISPTILTAHQSTDAHLSTIFYTLISFLLVALTREKPPKQASVFFVLLIFLLLFYFIGDPFGIIIGGIPIICISLQKLFHTSKRKERDVLIIYTCIITILLSKVIIYVIFALGGFRILHFLSYKFVKLSSLSQNFSLAVDGILRLFAADFFGKVLFSFLTIGKLVRFFLLTLVLYALYQALITVKQQKLIFDRITYLLAFGMLMDLLSFLFSSIPVDPDSVRYLTPFFIFGAILTGRVFAKQILVKKQYVIILSLPSIFLFLLFIYQLLTIKPVVQPEMKLVHWLQQQHLTYGYGSYWNASIITVESKNTVKVRAVTANRNKKLVPYYWLADNHWYELKGNPKATFLIFDNTNYGNVNEQTAINTFGQPKKIYSIDNYTIFVWDVNLTEKFY